MVVELKEEASSSRVPECDFCVDLTSFFALAELKSAWRLHQPPCTCHLQSSSCHSGLVVHSGHARKTGACQLAGFAKKTFSTPRLRTFNFAHEGFARLSSRRYHTSKKDKAGWLAYWQAFRWLQFDFLLGSHSCCGEGQDALVGLFTIRAFRGLLEGVLYIFFVPF